MTFLPNDYDIPDEKSNYMRFEQGDNRFRIMSSPILGMEYWVEKEGKRKPIRKRMNEKIVLENVPEPDKIKHFWAMIVFDYSDSKMKILEIAQKNIQRTLKGLSADEDWGDPKGTNGYDIVVNRKGEKFETTYQVTPKPKKKLDEGIVQLYKDSNINLDALYDGENPFSNESKEEVSDKEIDAIEKALA